MSEEGASAVAGPGPSSAANKRAANVTTTIITQDGVDSARVGACSNCRSRKIKCSGDRPICRSCAKNNQTCDYPLHISRKRKDRESSSKRHSEGVGGAEAGKRSFYNSSEPTRTSTSASGFRPDGPSGQALPDYPVNNFFPTIDFGVDSLSFQTQQADPDGLPIDNAWLENFLSYDFGNDLPLSVPGVGQAGAGGGGGMGPMGVPQNGGSASTNPLSTSPSGIGDGSQKGKSKAKFRVPYFRSVLSVSIRTSGEAC